VQLWLSCEHVQLIAEEDLKLRMSFFGAASYR
jgi:hypothetical protein